MLQVKQRKSIIVEANSQGGIDRLDKSFYNSKSPKRKVSHTLTVSASGQRGTE